MCAKIVVIWRWSKKCPHSGGTIWYWSQFLKKGEFFHHLQITPIFLYMVTHMCQTCLWKKFLKTLFYNAPLRHRPMFSAVSLEGIINSNKFKKIQNLENLALFVQEIMCAKIEVIWRWSKKCPHSGGTIWSFNLSQFLKKRAFFHHLQITQIFLYMVTHMCKTCVCKKILKKIILQCPLEA